MSFFLFLLLYFLKFQQDSCLPLFYLDTPGHISCPVLSRLNGMIAAGTFLRALPQRPIHLVSGKGEHFTGHVILLTSSGLPCGSVVKNLPANAGDVSLIPQLGRSPGERNGNPLQYSCLGNPRGAEQPGGLQFMGS